MSLVMEIYEGFQRGEFDRWDAVVAPDVVLHSPGGMNNVGLATLKGWAGEFVHALQPRIDLVDAYDGDGTRAFLTVCLYWKHVKPFFGIQPTGRSGTSVETFLLTLTDGKVTRWDVADNSLDLAIYLWERGWHSPHNVEPKALVRGIERNP